MRKWTIDPAHSHIQFAVKHMGISTVRGTFGDLEGTVTEHEGEVTSVEADVDLQSINTNMSARDEHLRGADFFDVEHFPKAHFTLTKFERAGDDVVAQGELTIRGVAKPVTLKGEIGGPAQDPWGNQKVSASVEGKISRKEWGLVWNQTLETGGLLVSDDVKLTIDVQATHAAA